MAPSKKIAKAIETMTSCGFPEKTVEKMLQVLLKKCKGKWKPIEDDSYSRLVHAIIESDQKHEKLEKELQKLSEDNQPLNRSKLKCQTARSSASGAESNVKDMGSPAHDEHKVVYLATEPSQQTNYNDIELMDADILHLCRKKGDGSDKTLSLLKPILKTKVQSSGTLDSETGDTYLGYPSLKLRQLALEESIHSADSKDINILTDVCPSPEVKSPVPLALILQEKSGFNNIPDENCSRSRGTNLLEMMNVDDEFDALPSPPCEQGVVKETLMTDQMNCGGVQDANLDQVCLSSIPDSPLEPYRVSNSLNLIHCKYDLKLKAISNGESEGIDDETSNGSSTPRPLMIIRSENQYFVEDITRGAEEEMISLINEINSEELPEFRYIPLSIPYCNAQVKFPLVHIPESNCCSICSGDCLSSGTPCICAEKSTGGFAYITGGVVKDGFIDKCISMNHKDQQQKLSFCEVCPLGRLSGRCNGHVIRNFIKECWYKCGCSKTCGNRTVQSGIRIKLQVFMTPEGKVWGLRTLEDLPRGAFICEYAGEIITTMELVERNMKNMDLQQPYSVLLDADWTSKGGIKDEEGLCLDGESYGNVARFINHRCHDANMIEIPVEVETPDHNYYHVAFFTTRIVKAMEELTWDYGINFCDDIKPRKVFQCCCGAISAVARKWQKLLMQERHAQNAEKKSSIIQERDIAHSSLLIKSLLQLLSTGISILL